MAPRVLTRSRNLENMSGFTHQSRVSSCICGGVYHFVKQQNQESLVRQPSPTENIPKAEPTQMEKLFTPPTPTVVATYLNDKPQTELAPDERLVSYVYCRICRRDPCRQPAATMCGHVFCSQCVLEVSPFLPVLLTSTVRCISSEVVKTSRCPVCEAPTLLYSIFRLHLV
jgi:hypothetical protein